MSTQLKASLQLKLEDQLTAGLGKLQKQMEQLRDLAKTLGLGDLVNGLDELRAGTGSIDAMTESLRGTERQADRTRAAIARMASANDNVIRVNAQGVASLTRSLGAMTVVAGGGSGTGEPFGGRDAAFGDVPLLAGPPGRGGIPINLGRNPLRGAIGAGRDLYGAGKNFTHAASNSIGGLMAAGAEAFAVYEPIKAYAEYENKLRHIAITERKSGAAVGVEIKRLTEMFAKDALATGQSSESIADAYSDLVQTGIPASVLDVAIKAHSKAATAYNISPQAMGPAVGALLQNLKIPENELGSALSAMAQASKEGRFKIEDFSRQLPGVSGVMASLGMTGRKSADIGFAALETVMKNASEPNQAATDLTQALLHLTEPISKGSFAKVGIDLPGLLKNAERKGLNPLDAVLGRLDKLIRGKTPVQASELLGTALHGHNSAMAIMSLLQHKKEFLELRKLLDGVSVNTLNTDFITAFAAPAVQLRIFNETLSQTERILGEGFAPVMMGVNIGLLKLLQGLTWMNTHMPQTLHWVLGVTAGMLAFGAVLTMIGVVVPLIAAGFAVLMSPIVLVTAAVLALEAGVYELYEHWRTIVPFFQRLWAEVKGVFNEFVTWVDSWALDLGARIAKGITSAFHNAGSAVHFGLDLHDPFGADTALGRLLHPERMPQLQTTPSEQLPRAGLPGSPSGPAARADKVDFVVRAERGTEVTQMSSTSPYHSFNSSNTGRVLSRT